MTGESNCAVMAAEPGTGLRFLLTEGARALECDGDLRAARRSFHAAYREADRAGDVEAMAEAALGLGGLWVHEQRTAAGSALIEQRLCTTLALVDPRSSTALRLRIRLAGERCYRTGDPTAILALLEEARAAGTPVARAEALSIAHHCLLGPQHAALRRTLAAGLVAESVHTGRRSDLMMGLLWQAVDLFLDGDPHAGRRLAELRQALARGEHLAVGYVADAIDVMLAIRAGDLDRAESLAYACQQRGEATGDIDATWWFGAQLVAIRWYQGRLAQTVPMLRELVNSPTLSAVDNSCLAALALACAVAGDRPAAEGALARLYGGDLAALPRSSTWLATMNGIVEAAFLLDDADTAARAYRLLLPYAHLPMMGSLGVVCFGSAEHALGVASLTTDDLDRAIEHLRAAVQHNLALTHWPAVVASRHRLALALRRRGHPADLAEAHRELSAAAGQAGALGMPIPSLDTAKRRRAALSCTREGRGWRVSLGHRSVLVEHRVGMLHLAVLVANPGQEIDAVSLAAGPDALGRRSTIAAGVSQPKLDRVAVEQYRRRLAELGSDIDRLEADGRAAGAARAREERDWLLSELSSASGFGGRVRDFADSGERARIAVGKAIRRAVDRIAAADPVIGEHLAHSIHTGTRCAYWPG